MTMEHFDDETLMAFADGELDAATGQRLEAALETDDALAERLAVFLDTRMAVGSAMKPLIDEPVPEALAANVRRMAEAAETKAASEAENNVLAFQRAGKRTAVRSGQPWMMPIAASILAVITGVGGYMAGRGSVEPGAALESALSAALDRQPSGSDVALGKSEALHIVSSFIDGQGELCREYEVKRQNEATATVACRSDGNWVTRLALSSPRAEGYVPASSQETIDAYLASIDAGEPLSAEAEKNALAGKAE